MADSGLSSADAQLLEAAISLKQEKVEEAVVHETKKTSFEMGLIVVILLMPLFFYFVERQSSIFFCNSFDNGLATKLACAIQYGKTHLPPSQFEFSFPVWEITMCLRSTLSGLWSMLFLEHGTNRQLIPGAIQYIATSNSPSVEFQGAPLATAFADPQTAAAMLDKLYANADKVKQDASVFDFVCKSLSIDAGACKPPTPGSNCGGQVGAAAISGAANGAMMGAFAFSNAKSIISALSLDPETKPIAIGLGVGLTVMGAAVGSAALKHC